MPTGQRPDPPAHTIHITALGTLDGFPWANTFWLRNGNAQTPVQADFTTVVNNFGSKYVTNFLPHLSHTLIMSEFSALYYETGGASLAAAVGYSTIGGDPGNTAPANVSCCIGWRVQAHYRGGHPRTYLAGIPTSKFANSRQFSTAYASAVAGSAAAFHREVNGLSAGALSSLKLGIVSFVLRKEWRNPPVFRDFIIDSAHVDPRIDSMRRRLGRDIPP